MITKIPTIPAVRIRYNERFEYGDWQYNAAILKLKYISHIDIDARTICMTNGISFKDVANEDFANVLSYFEDLLDDCYDD